MNRILIIGAGGVGSVATMKCAMNPAIFTEIHLASRTIAKCEIISQNVEQKTSQKIHIHQIDADDVLALTNLLNDIQPNLVMNLALPYQDLHIMDACLNAGISYLDTANYEPPEEAHFEYSHQWAYRTKFEKAGLTAILGCGFDPGMTGVYTAWLAKHEFSEIQELDIVDCNGGDHGQAFATNFNPEINIREITQNGRYWKDGSWVQTKPLELHQEIEYPEIGPRESYLLYHEELESLSQNFPSLKQARFWMTFGQEYLTHLRVLQNVGMTSIEPIEFEGKEIIPLQFLKALLPEPSALAENYVGKTCIGVQIKGLNSQDNSTQKFIWNNCDHHKAYTETGGQAVAYTTAIPAVTGAIMFFKELWKNPGVWNVENFDPDPFMEEVSKQGLPWNVSDQILVG